MKYMNRLSYATEKTPSINFNNTGSSNLCGKNVNFQGHIV